MKQYLHFVIIITIVAMIFSSYQSKYEIYAAPPSPFITLDPTSGIVGSQVTVVGGDFKKNDLATITYDGIVVGSVYTGKGNTGGAFSITITVPSSTAGAHTIKATDTQGNIATATFTVVPSISMSPMTGAVGSTVTLSGTGYTGLSTVTINYDGSTVTTIPGTITTDASGSFSATFTIPASTSGVHTIQATDTSSKTSSETFTVIPSASMIMNPKTGKVGSTVTVSGARYTGLSTVTINYDGSPVTTTSASLLGSFSTTFTVPSSVNGVHTVQSTDGINSNSISFTVRSSIETNTHAGKVGSTVTLSGTGYTGLSTVTIKFGGNTVTTSPGTITTDSAGSFSATFTIPASETGAYLISATDTAGKFGDKLFSVIPSASMNPTTGAVGSTVTVSGNGTMGSSTVTVRYDGSTVTTTTSSSVGSFSTIFIVPASVVGAHTVRVSDGINSASGIFTIVPAVTINPTAGVVGSSTIVSGTGYASSSTITIKFDGNTVTTPVIITNASGSFSVSFTVPLAAAGVHTIQATDASGNTASHTFTFIIIPSPVITTNPTTGAVGSTVTLSGTGYTGLSTVTINYDGSTVTTIPGTITTDASGSFSATFTIPASTSGVHTIQATDTSSKTSSETFTVIPSASINPTTGESGITVSVSGTGYASLSTITIQFGGSTITTSPSAITTSSTGSFSGTFTVPNHVEGDYTVQASDGTNHNSVIFTIVSDPLTPNNIPVTPIGGSTSGGPPPSFATGFLPNEYPLSIDGKNYKLPSYTNSIPTAVFETGKSIKLSLLSFSNRGPDSIQHMALYTNLHGLNSDIYQSDTYIIYERGEIAQVADPHNFFTRVDINAEPVGNKLKVEFDITFEKPMDKSHIILRTWNDHRNSMDTKILDALQVVQSTNTAKPIQTMTSNIIIEKSQTESNLLHIMTKPEMQKLNREKQIQQESTKIAKDKAKADALIKASQSKFNINSINPR